MSKLTISGKESRIDKQELIRLAVSRKPNGQKYTHTDIANQFGVTRGAVTKALAKIPKSMLLEVDIDNYRKQRAQIFAEMQKLVLEYITPTKLKNASIQQLGNLFKMFYENERLESNLATEHVAVIHQSTIDQKSMKLIEEAIMNATQKKLVAAKHESKLLAQGKMVEVYDDEDD